MARAYFSLFAPGQGYNHALRLLLNTGSLDVPSSAMELDLAKAGMHMLVEKPISMRPEEEVQRLGKVCQHCPPSLESVDKSSGEVHTLEIGRPCSQSH